VTYSVVQLNGLDNFFIRIEESADERLIGDELDVSDDHTAS